MYAQHAITVFSMVNIRQFMDISQAFRIADGNWKFHRCFQVIGETFGFADGPMKENRIENFRREFALTSTEMTIGETFWKIHRQTGTVDGIGETVHRQIMPFSTPPPPSPLSHQSSYSIKQSHILTWSAEFHTQDVFAAIGTLLKVSK